MRITPRDSKLVDFKDSAMLTGEELNKAIDQVFYTQQELDETVIASFTEYGEIIESKVIEATDQAVNAKASEVAAKASELAAKASEDNALESETHAKASEVAAKASEVAAKASELAAKASEDNALESETHAKASEVAAKASEDNALESETHAKASEVAAKASEVAAKASELAAKASEDNALESETHAKTSEVAAENSAALAESYSLLAFGASAPAWDVATTYNYPDVVAFTDGHTYRCIGSNVLGASHSPITSNQDWQRISVEQGRQFFEEDANSDYMPTLDPYAHDGVDGNSVLVGEGDPSSELGKAGDSYIDKVSWGFWEKRPGIGWVNTGNIDSNFDVTGSLALKADITYVDAGLALKADTTDVDDALALKADSADVADALALKADAADVMNALESSVNENIPIFDGVEGNRLKDSGVKLSDKADITALETEKKLLMDEIDALKKATIENSNAPYLTVSDYGDVTLAKNSVGVGTVGIDGVTVENMIANGDFSNGTTGWSNLNLNINESGNLVASIPPTGDRYPRILHQGCSVVAGHKYYARAKMRFINGSPIRLSLHLGLGSSEGPAIKAIDSPENNTWYTLSGTITMSTTETRDFWIYSQQTSSEASIGGILEVEGKTGVILFDLTAHGLDSMTVEQLDKLVPSFFSGKKTFGGMGCLVSKDSAGAETGRMYFETDPMYSNDTAKDVLTYSGGKYYHTHNVDSDGVAIAEPYDTEVDTNGQIVCLSGGTVTYEPWFPDIGIYTDKFILTKAITAVKELYKYGSETPITDAVIAGDGLSFTSASLTAGDLAYGVFEFDEPLRPLMTIKSRNDDATVVDTDTGTVYTFRPVVTNGAIVSWALTEV